MNSFHTNENRANKAKYWKEKLIYVTEIHIYFTSQINKKKKQIIIMTFQKTKVNSIQCHCNSKKVDLFFLIGTNSLSSSFRNI